MKHGMSCLFPLLGVLLSACGQPADPDDDGLVLLSEREQLLRLSVDLRGTHPTETELQALEADPDLYAHYVDRWLQTDAFLDRMVEIWNGRFLTLTGAPHGFEREGRTDLQLGMAVGSEPLALFREIVADDLPYAEIVLSETTRATPLLADLYGLDRSAGTGWTPATYTDGRPHAGILSMNGTWLRYPSMGGNANRHRANAVSKLLMCDDYLSRPIVLNRAAVDQLTVDPESAIATNEACQSCHATLDPLAAHFFGFFEAEDEEVGIVYRPENEELWRNHADKSPAFYGRPTANLRELAEAIAEDPRFVDCAVQTAWEGLLQRPVTDADWTALQDHRDAFLAHDQSVRELVRSIVLSAEYRAGAAADPVLAERFVGVRTASPAQLASVVEGITGYRWRFDGADGLTTGVVGLPVLLGGIDSEYVVDRSYAPGVGTLFGHERLAWSAAWHVASADLDVAREGEARLFPYVTVGDTPEGAPEAFAAQIRHLYLHVTGLPLDEEAPEPAQLTLLWKQVYSVEADPVKAWAAVLSAVLRDPRVLTY